MRRLIKKFSFNEAGNFAIIFGLCLTPVMMAAGMAVDYSRMLNLQNRVQASADSAILSASKELYEMRRRDASIDTNEEFAEILNAQFMPFFRANMNAGGFDQEGIVTLDFDDEKQIASGSVTVEYDPVIMNIFDYEDIPITSDFAANLKIVPQNYVFDIVMCVDATGSMQTTLDAAVQSANSFDKDLRAEMKIEEDDKAVKIRVRPIFYRDWREQEKIDEYKVTLAELWNTSGLVGSRPIWSNLPEYNNLIATYKSYLANNKHLVYWNGRKFFTVWNDYAKATHSFIKYDGPLNGWKPESRHHVVKYQGSKYWIFEANDKGVKDLMKAGSIWFSANLDNENFTFHERFFPKAINAKPDFIDLNPNQSSGETRSENITSFVSFMGTESARGGGDLPEAAGTCLNQGIRSNWWEPDSELSREYFNISADTQINNPEARKSADVKVLPIIVFWTDAGIQYLPKTKRYIDSSQPRNYGDFEDLWSDAEVIPQDGKLLIMFGPDPESATTRSEARQGWTELVNWDGWAYGGTLETGNQNGVEVIAKKIIESTPEVLFLGL